MVNNNKQLQNNNKKNAHSTHKNIKLSTSTNIDESKYEIIDIIQGVCIRSFGALRRFSAGLTTIIGGPVKDFEEKYEEAYEDALGSIMKKADSLNADAIYGLIPEVSELSMGTSDGVLVITMFGTAVRLKTHGGRRSSYVCRKKKVKKSVKKNKQK